MCIYVCVSLLHVIASYELAELKEKSKRVLIDIRVSSSQKKKKMRLKLNAF